MRLAFYCPRRNFLKHYGPIIAAAKRRGWTTVLAIPPYVLSTGKDDAYMDRDGLLQESGADLRQVVWDAWDPVRHGIDWVVSVGLRLPPWLDRVRQGSRPVRWASLDHIQESLLQVLEDGPRRLEGWDLAATGSEEGLEALSYGLFGSCRAAGRWTVSGFRVVGYPHLDPLATTDKAACRAKWNLPGSGRIVLLAPAARPALLDRWWWRSYAATNPVWGAYYWINSNRPAGVGMMPYRDILRAFRRWADRHGAFVVAKVRDKTPCLGALDGIADRVIGDEAFHPFTTLELCRAADVYVGLASAMAIEATAASLPQVHVLAYPSEAYEVPAYLPLRRRFYLTFPGLWTNWWSESYETFLAQDRTGLARWAAEAPWPNGPASDCSALERLAGPQDGCASERFLDCLADSS